MVVHDHLYFEVYGDLGEDGRLVGRKIVWCDPLAFKNPTVTALAEALSVNASRGTRKLADELEDLAVDQFERTRAETCEKRKEA